ncbi:hypothetical protein [Georgenia sp. SUBG003]|uniref:hypothetical protein n=1 Tax=Georgenia sp. SUBG003 TaxID=1497974 RepID=UPI003AB57FA6
MPADQRVAQGGGGTEHGQKTTARGPVGEHLGDSRLVGGARGGLDEPQQGEERAVGVRDLAERLGQRRTRRVGGVEIRLQRDRLEARRGGGRLGETEPAQRRGAGDRPGHAAALTVPG